MDDFCFLMLHILTTGYNKRLILLTIAVLPEYVTEHWREDDFFGYQFMNAFNPNEIKKCSELPSNFPVTNEMVNQFLEKGSSLQKEMEVWKKIGFTQIIIFALGDYL